jgi:hypothetical protein
MRISLPDHMGDYIQSIGTQIGESDPSRVVVFILQDHRRGTRCNFAADAGGISPPIQPLPPLASQEVQAEQAEPASDELAADLAAMWGA